MLLAKKVRHLLNGGGDAAGVQGVRDMIRAIENSIVASRAEIAEIPRKRAEAVLSDDAEKSLYELSTREDALFVSIEVAQSRIEKLRARLDELTITERCKEFAERHVAVLAAAEKFIVAAHAAHAATTELNLCREQMHAARFAVELASIPLAPGLINLCDQHQSQLRMFEDAIAKYRKSAPKSPAIKATPPKISPVKNFDPNVVIPHGAPKGPVALYQTTGATAEGARLTAKFLNEGGPPHFATARPAKQSSASRPSAAPPAAVAQKPKPAPMTREQRVLPERAPEGHRRCRVIRSGYPDADGKVLLQGEIVDVVNDTANLAALNGAVEFVADENGGAA